MKAAGFKEIPLSPSWIAEGPFQIGADLAAQEDQTVVHLPLTFHKKKAVLLMKPETVVGSDPSDLNEPLTTVPVEYTGLTMSDLTQAMQDQMLYGSSYIETHYGKPVGVVAAKDVVLTPGKAPQLNFEVKVDSANFDAFNQAKKQLQMKLANELAPALAKMGGSLKHSMQQMVKLHFPN